MIFITGPLYSGKRTFAQKLPGTRLCDVQTLAADAADLPGKRPAALPACWPRGQTALCRCSAASLLF